MIQTITLTKTQINLNIQDKSNSTFGTEDEELLKHIFQSYKKFFDMENKEQKSKKFIGKIKRVIHKNTTKELQTLDEVHIYTKTISLFGESLPIISKNFVITTWKEGYPERHQFTTLTCVKGSATKKVFSSTFPFESTVEREEIIREAPYSYIYCLPNFQGDESYHYFSSFDDFDVSFSDYLNQCIQRCEQILQHHVEEEDKFEEAQLEEDQEQTNFYQYDIEAFEKSPLYQANPNICDKDENSDEQDETENTSEEEDESENSSEEEEEIEEESEEESEKIHQIDTIELCSPVIN